MSAASPAGIFQGDAEETLEEAQIRKMDVICKKIQLRENEKVLDIGCGWGTLVCYMADKYKADATGTSAARKVSALLLSRGCASPLQD